MTTKNIFKLGLLAGCSILAFTSCNDIPESDRLIEVAPIEVKRVVLIQEFTGLWCSNCPKGAKVVHDLQEEYPGSIIAVNMHPNDPSQNRPLNGLSLTSDEAIVMYKAFNPKGFPSALVNGVGPYELPELWRNYVSSALKEETKVGISINTAYNASTRKLDVDYNVNFTDNYNGELSVMVWIIENDIKGWQIDDGKPDKNYTHQHVLRASANGEWGQQIGNNFSWDQSIDGKASIVLDEEWVAENCQVVAYVFQTGSKYVEQATIADVIAK